eukprot:339261-Prorocentrum_minimum.AAC.1
MLFLSRTARGPPSPPKRAFAVIEPFVNTFVSVSFPHCAVSVTASAKACSSSLPTNVRFERVSTPFFTPCRARAAFSAESRLPSSNLFETFVRFSFPYRARVAASTADPSASSALAPSMPNLFHPTKKLPARCASTLSFPAGPASLNRTSKVNSSRGADVVSVTERDTTSSPLAPKSRA